MCVCDVQAELAEDQQRYLKYFTHQLEKRKEEEEEIDLLMEEALKEVWAQRDQQRRAEREARNRLMKEVMETRSLQIQHKREEVGSERVLSLRRLWKRLNILVVSSRREDLVLDKEVKGSLLCGLICFAVSLNMEKQEELIRERDELDRLMAEMKLEEDDKEKWYANKHSVK